MVERTLLRLIEQWESESCYQTDAIGYRVGRRRSYDFNGEMGSMGNPPKK